MEESTFGVVLDMAGVIQSPQRPYAVVEEMNRLQRPAHPDLVSLQANINANAPTPHGLPDGAPNPNTVYLRNGQPVRYVIDTSETIEPRVKVTADGKSQVVRDVRFTPRLVCLSLDAARKASQAGNKADFWNGWTWIRNGYIPERDYQTIIAQSAKLVEGAELVFEQAVSANDEAVIRHAVSAMDRARPTLPVEAGAIPGEVTAATSVPFPVAVDAARETAADIEIPTDPFAPGAPPRAAGRPRKVDDNA